MRIAPVAGKWHRGCRSQGPMKPLGVPMVTAPTESLVRHRNRVVAKSFYRQLRSEGFSHEQIIELSATLLDLVTEDMKQHQQAS